MKEITVYKLKEKKPEETLYKRLLKHGIVDIYLPMIVTSALYLYLNGGVVHG